MMFLFEISNMGREVCITAKADKGVDSVKLCIVN